jgi:murein L,D-transpeptidase YcbB/YkuD
MDEKDTQEVRLARPMPVVILYMTAWTEDDGALGFGDDVYGLDAELAEMLARSHEERIARRASPTS